MLEDLHHGNIKVMHLRTVNLSLQKDSGTEFFCFALGFFWKEQIFMIEANYWQESDVFI